MWCKAAWRASYVYDVTTIVTIGRKVCFQHTLPFMTKQRCSSAAATSRLHQKFGIIDTSVTTSDILTWHQLWCSQINFWCLMFWRQIWCWLDYCFCSGTEFAKKVWQSLLFAFRWRHHVHSTVVRPFCKIDKMGIATSSIYKHTMVLYLNI